MPKPFCHKCAFICCSLSFVCLFFWRLDIWWKHRQWHHCVEQVKQAHHCTLRAAIAGRVAQAHINEDGDLRLSRYMPCHSASSYSHHSFYVGAGWSSLTVVTCDISYLPYRSLVIQKWTSGNRSLHETDEVAETMWMTMLYNFMHVV